jgi:hypothetical protein
LEKRGETDKRSLGGKKMVEREEDKKKFKNIDIE